MVKKEYFYTLVVINLVLIIMVLYLFNNPPLHAQTAVPTTTQEIIETIPVETTIKEPDPTPSPIPVETTVETTRAPRYGFTDAEIYLLAQLLCGEEKTSGDGEYDFVWRGKCEEPYFPEMSKVLCVVMNRQRSGCFPDTVREIIVQKGQFSVIPNNLDAKVSAVAVDAVRQWCEAYDNYDESMQTIPENHLYFRAGPNNTNISRTSWK